MKTLENKTVYRCDFCSKKLFVKSAMVKHETYCSHNPVNHKACTLCKHISKTTYEYSPGDDYSGEPVIMTAAAFRCSALNKLVYPTKVERLGLVKQYPDQFEDQIPMPKECDKFEGTWQ